VVPGRHGRFHHDHPLEVGRVRPRAAIQRELPTGWPSSDEQGRTGKAIDHYRAFLELVVEQQPRLQLAAVDIIPVVMKFAEALVRAGRHEEARMRSSLPRG